MHLDGITVCDIKWCNHCSKYLVDTVGHEFSSSCDDNWVHRYAKEISEEQVRKVKEILGL